MVRACFSDTITTNCESFMSVEDDVGDTLLRLLLKFPAPELEERDIVKEPDRLSSSPELVIAEAALEALPIPLEFPLLPVGVAVLESLECSARPAIVPE